MTLDAAETKMSMMQREQVLQPIEFTRERARRFAGAMQMCPHARDAELQQLLAVLKNVPVRQCRCIVELGAGHGYATRLLLKLLSPDGVVHAVDVSEEMLDGMRPDSHIVPVVAKPDQLQLADASVDLVVSVATFHHILNKNQVFAEMQRVLRPGGVFVIADVYDRTPTQRFFDEVVRYYCITGHEADFLSTEWMNLLSARSGLKCVSSSVQDTKWGFASEAECYSFMRELFSLEIDLSDLETAVTDIFGPIHHHFSGSAHLPWSLGYHVLFKAAF
jgi:SAM-dependent methyltransferase